MYDSVTVNVFTFLNNVVIKGGKFDDISSSGRKINTTTLAKFFHCNDEDFESDLASIEKPSADVVIDQTGAEESRHCDYTAVEDEEDREAQFIVQQELIRAETDEVTETDAIRRRRREANFDDVFNDPYGDNVSTKNDWLQQLDQDISHARHSNSMMAKTQLPLNQLPRAVVERQREAVDKAAATITEKNIITAFGLVHRGTSQQLKEQMLAAHGL